MRTIFLYLEDFIRREAKFAYILLIFLILSILIWLNYWHDLEIKYIANHRSWLLNYLSYFLLYFIPFSCAFLFQKLFFKENNYAKSKWFWIILFIAPMIFSFRVNSNFFDNRIIENYKGQNYFFVDHSVNWVIQAIVTIIPLFIFWKIKDSRNMPFYGTARLTRIRIYWYMLAFMVPLIALASTQPDFLARYPRVHALLPLQSMSEYLRMLVFELSYGLSFLSIEFFFRGFLVLSLLKICGTRSIIPIACFYVSIHMGKPMGEAISSFFGGVLLGVVTYHTRSIWGGLIVHLGIAWLMEIGGIIGRQLF